MRYTVGINNVGSYQVAGRPFTKNALQTAGTTTIEFPKVTKQIIFINRGAADMYVFFDASSPAGNKFKISAGEQQTFDVKCNWCSISGPSK